MRVKLPKLVSGFNIRRQQRLPDLGERELLVLDVLWESGEATAQAVHNEMPDEGVSLSTVQSTLERLHRKRLIERAKQGRAFRYRPTMNKSQLIAGLLRDMACQVADGDMAPMISGFLSYVSAEAPELLGGVSESLGVAHSADAEGLAGGEDD